MRVRIEGGPLDGRTIDAIAPRIKVPMVTTEWARAYGEWHEQWYVAWMTERLMAIPENPATPPPPEMPMFLYDVQQRGDEYVGLPS